MSLVKRLKSSKTGYKVVSFSYVLWAVIVMPLLVSGVLQSQSAQAALQSATVTKNAASCVDVAGVGTSSWTSPTDAQATDGVVASVSLNKVTSDYLRCTNYGFSIPSGATITMITANITRMASKSRQNDSFSIMKANALAGTVQTASNAWSTNTLQTDSFSGASSLWGTTWLAGDINNSGFGFSMYVQSTGGGPITYSVDSITLAITYSFNPTFTQAAYQWFTNTNSASVGTGYNGAAQNTAIATIPGGDIFRLRMLLRVGGDVAPAGSYYPLKLQYAARGTDNSCDASFIGETYADITTATPIAYASNSGVTDGSTVVAAATPIDGSNTVIPQEYNDTNNTNIAQNIVAGQDGLWDFALKDATETYGAVYCLRMVNADGTTFGSASNYLAIPQISTSPGQLSAGFVDSTGNAISAPSFTMPMKYVLSTCQISTTSFGSSGGDKLRVAQTGNAGAAGWTVSVAPTDGSTALWYASATNQYFDFNDPTGSPPGCANGSDGDTYAGQLSFALSSAAATPQSGCAATGLSLGNSTVGFTTTTTAITLLSASSTVQNNCYWDYYGAGISQTIPPNPGNGQYMINLTVTVANV